MGNPPKNNKVKHFHKEVTIRSAKEALIVVGQIKILIIKKDTNSLIISRKAYAKFIIRRSKDKIGSLRS
jgi:hypothetical protein